MVSLFYPKKNYKGYSNVVSLVCFNQSRKEVSLRETAYCKQYTGQAHAPNLTLLLIPKKKPRPKSWLSLKKDQKVYNL